jgi:hypothetical protein
LILLVVADGVVTNILIKKDLAWEGNPFLQGVAGGYGLIIVKVVGVLVAAGILWDVHRRNPRVAFWISLAFVLVYAAIVVWNVRILILG